MKKKLPVVTSRPTPASAQTELAAKPVSAGSRPEFPTRTSAYRSAGLLGGAAAILSGGIASADSPPPVKKAPDQATKPTPPVQEPVKTPDAPVKVDAAVNGSINGTAIDLKKQPKFKVYREGGGIGPAEDMWEPSEVEAFINWTLAKEGKLALKTKAKFDYDGVSIELDAFDADKKMGYVYVDKLDGSPSVSKETKAKFDAWMKAKKVAILFIDQKKNPDQATLKARILKFVGDVKKAPLTPGAL